MRSDAVIGAELLLAAALVLLAAVSSSLGSGAARPARNAWAPGPQRAGVLEARCGYDLAHGPVRVTVEPWSGPFSLTVRSGDGAALFDADERTAAEGVDLVLALRDQVAPSGARVVVTPTPRGVAVQRRPAATPDLVARAEQARRGDACGPVGVDFPAARPR